MSSQKSRIYLHLGTDLEIRVLPEDVDKYLEQGYEKGHSESTKRRIGQKHIGKIWINNGLVEQTTLSLDNLPEGFRQGRLPRTKEHSRAISLATKGRVDSEKTRERKRQAKLGKHWTVVDGRRVWSK